MDPCCTFALHKHKQIVHNIHSKRHSWLQGSVASGVFLGGKAKLVALVGVGPSATLDAADKADAAAKALKVDFSASIGPGFPLDLQST